jgi:hypothetical protein
MIMIKATASDYERDDGTNRYVLATLVADTCDEVIAHGTSGNGVVNLQKNDVMTFGSTCLCVDGKFGMLDSNGVWSFR